MSAPIDVLPERPSPVAAFVWCGIALLVTCAGLAGLAIGIADSEENGVLATIVVAFPLGFAWSAAIAALATYFMRRLSPPLRIGAPFGCGCLGGGALFVVCALFFAVIFPEL